MSDAYRDEVAALHAKNEKLVSDLAARDAELDALRRRVAEENAVFARLEGVLERKSQTSSQRWLLGGAAVAIVGVFAGLCFFLGRSRTRAPEPPAPAEEGRPAVTPRPVAEDAAGIDAACERIGVHLTVDGEDADALAIGPRDLAGHKFRPDGSRSPWLTVEGGPLYVHAVGGFLPGDVGSTQLSLLTILTKGDAEGYRLARGGRSLFVVARSDRQRVAGRFEADVSRVADTTREPPFGTPVVRVRGTFCLPAVPDDPSDTGP